MRWYVATLKWVRCTLHACVLTWIATENGDVAYATVLVCLGREQYACAHTSVVAYVRMV